MTETQIQVPDEPMARRREFAGRREWTLAGTFRRGVEMLLEDDPSGDPVTAEEGQAPVADRKRGWKNLSDEPLGAAWEEDRESVAL